MVASGDSSEETREYIGGEVTEYAVILCEDWLAGV